MKNFDAIHIWNILWYLSLGKIKELFTKDAITDATVLVLVNAVYFKAKWEKYFDSENTVDAPFYISEVLSHSTEYSRCSIHSFHWENRIKLRLKFKTKVTGLQLI